MLLGIILNILFELAEIFGAKNPGRMFEAVLTGAIFAFIPLGIYLFVPAIIDRYDPEPWWCLAMAFLWGAVVATGLWNFINTMVHIGTASAFGKGVGDFVAAGDLRADRRGSDQGPRRARGLRFPPKRV